MQKTGEPQRSGQVEDRPRTRRRRSRTSAEARVLGDESFSSPRASVAHLERIEHYRQLVEERGWIFAPPSPPLPLSALFDYLTDRQLESLSS